MTKADAKETVPVGRDQPPAVVDALGVKETCLFALDVEESAVSIELLPIGRSTPMKLKAEVFTDSWILIGLRGSRGLRDGVLTHRAVAHAVLVPS